MSTTLMKPYANAYTDRNQLFEETKHVFHKTFRELGNAL